MSDKPENPQAFPTPGYATSNTAFSGTEGMTMRDYFAAKAMQAEMITTFSDATPESAEAFVEGCTEHEHTPEQHLAFNAYKIADAMLKQRNA